MEDPRKNQRLMRKSQINITNNENGYGTTSNPQNFEEFLNLQYQQSKKKDIDANKNERETIPQNSKQGEENQFQTIIGDYYSKDQEKNIPPKKQQTEQKIKYIIEHMPDVAEDVRVMTSQQIDGFYHQLKVAEQTQARKQVSNQGQLTFQYMVQEIVPYIQLTKQQLLQKSYNQIKDIYNGLIVMIKKSKQIVKDNQEYQNQKDNSNMIGGKEKKKLKKKERQMKQSQQVQRNKQLNQIEQSKFSEIEINQDQFISENSKIENKCQKKSYKQKSKVKNNERGNIDEIRKILMAAMGPKLAKKVKKLDDETLFSMYRQIQKEEQEMKKYKRDIRKSQQTEDAKQKLKTSKIKSIRSNSNVAQDNQKQKSKRLYSISQMIGQYDKYGNIIYQKQQLPTKAICLNNRNYTRKEILEQDLKAIERLMKIVKDQE